MKKLIALLLALVMVLGMVACGGNDAPAADAPAADAPAADAPAADAPAADEDDDMSEFVELTWYCCGQPQPGAQDVYDAMNEYLKEKLNCSINIISYDYGSYDEMLNLAAQSGEEFDICFTSNWLFDHDTAARKGYIIPMEDLIAKYGQDYVASVPEMYRNDALVDGKAYSIVNYQIECKAGGLVIRKDIADKYNFDTTQVKTLDDLTPLFEAIKADDPTMYGYMPDPTGGLLLPSNTTDIVYEPLFTRNHPAFVKEVDGKLQVINIFEEAEYIDQLKTLHDWYKKGYIRSDAASLTDFVSEQQSGKYASWLAGSTKPGCDIDQLNLTGWPCYVQQCEVDVASRSMTVATCTGISATSKHPVRAMKFLNLLWADEYLFNLLTHGIQDVHWEWANEEDKIVRNISADYNPVVEWAYGNQFLAYPREGQTATVWEETKARNEGALPTKLGSFAYDDSNLKTENAMVNAVIEEYYYGFFTGTLDPETALPEFYAELDAAGWDLLVADIQAQLDAYLGQ